MRLEDDGSYSDDEDAVGAGGPFRGTATINFGAPGTYEVRISGESRAAVPGGRLTLELFGRGLTDSAGEAIQGGALELRYSLTDTLALGIGYSTVGTADPDLQLVAPWTEGVFVRVTETF